MTFLWAGGWILLAAFLARNAVEARSILPLLLAVESGLIGVRLAARRQALAEAGWGARAAAWGSAALPMLIQVTETPPLAGTLLACAGALLTMWALLSLGKSFGIAPADRGLVVSGPYRFLRHPMYAGALLVAAVTVSWNVSLWNLAVLVVSGASAALRIVLEERTLIGYALYASCVRWRLIPWVW